MDMLFFEGEIEKVSQTVGSAKWNTMSLQDPRINGQLLKDEIARETEKRNLQERRARLLKGYD